MKIHADHQPYRKKPYVARWYEGTRQRNKFFASVAARDEFIHQLKETAQRQDPVLPTIPPHQLIRWQQAIAIAPEADPVEVFKFWKAEQRKIAKLGDRYLHDAAAAYLQSMENVGRNAAYIQHVRRALADLEAEFGNRLVREFSTEELRDCLFGLPYRPITIKNKRTYFQGAFGWWDKQGWLTENPMKRVESPQIQDKEPEILTVAEARALFRANEKIDPEICGLLALGAWIKLKSKQMEVQRNQADLWAKQVGVVLEDRQKARDFIPPGGPLTRRIIVLAVLFTVIIAPFILAAFFPHTPVFYAYAEKTRGFWFIFESLDKMRFEQMAGYVILPVHTQMAAAISGFYFGGGLAK